MHRCPNYLDTRFQIKFTRLIKAFAAHVKTLPDVAREQVVAAQAAFGITGDDRPWNGVPVKPGQVISPQQWKNYTRAMAMVYCDAFSEVELPVLYNLENPGYDHSDDQWIVKQCPGSMVKEGIISHAFQTLNPPISPKRNPHPDRSGIVSHGYQLNGELDLYNTWHAQGLGNVLSRGELAVEPNPSKAANTNSQP